MPEAPPPVLRVAWKETQTAQSAIIGLPASCVLTAVTPPPALTVVHGKAKEIEAVGRNLQVMPGQISDNEKPEPGRVFPPSQSPVWDLNSAKRRMCLPPGQTQSSEKGDLNLVLSFPRTRPRYGI